MVSLSCPLCITKTLFHLSFSKEFLLRDPGVYFVSMNTCQSVSIPLGKHDTAEIRGQRCQTTWQFILIFHVVVYLSHAESEQHVQHRCFLDLACKQENEKPTNKHLGISFSMKRRPGPGLVKRVAKKSLLCLPPTCLFVQGQHLANRIFIFRPPLDKYQLSKRPFPQISPPRSGRVEGQVKVNFIRTPYDF